jgi:hypothetical protein
VSIQFQLDRAGIAEILKSQEMAAAVDDLAEKIAADVRSTVDDDVPVDVDSYTTDRAAAAVTIVHPTGMGLQARNGVLTRAAAAAGLDVRSR